MSQLEIRQAEERDTDAIAALEKICFAVPWTRDAIWQELVENERAFYIVATLDKDVVGYAGLWRILDEGHITNVAVRPEYRNRKIASAIISVMLEFTELQGILHHTLEVRRSNEAAKTLYLNFGFEPAGVRNGYYQDNGEDAIIMWRSQNQLDQEQ